MIGRQAYHQPYFLAELEHHFNPGWDQPSRADVVEEMLPYVEREVANGVPLNSISRHMLGLFAGQPGARAWRRYISERLATVYQRACTPRGCRKRSAG
jgi:tRNA-dihydrouridine synthase A